MTSNSPSDKAETPEQYQARLAGYVRGKDALALQREAPRTLERLIAGVSEERLRRRPARRNGRW